MEKHITPFIFLFFPLFVYMYIYIFLFLFLLVDAVVVIIIITLLYYVFLPSCSSYIEVRLHGDGHVYRKNTKERGKNNKNKSIVAAVASPAVTLLHQDAPSSLTTGLNGLLCNIDDVLLSGVEKGGVRPLSVNPSRVKDTHTRGAKDKWRATVFPI